jgi:heme-degrading monooxygenase HmoA
MKHLLLSLLAIGVLSAEEPSAILARAQSNMQKAGELAQKADFGPANVLMAEAFADYDKAVDAAPGDFRIRFARAIVYGQLPPFLNKTAAARKDLEWVIRQKDFAALPLEQQSRTYVLLGMATRDRAHFAKAVELAPETSAGRRAAEELAKMKQPVVAFDGAGRPMPDRFEKVGVDVSPLMAAATVTLPGENITKERMAFITDAMKDQPGLLATHLLQSVDHPGMAVLLTWWKDKIALNNFFYGEIHRSLTTRIYGQPAKAAQSGSASQVGLELFTVLPAGSRVGGGVVPENLFQAVLKSAVK